MNLSSDLLLFFRLASLALIAFAVARYPLAPRPQDYAVWAAAISVLAHPVALAVAQPLALDWALTRFLAFHFIPWVGIAAAAAGAAPLGGAARRAPAAREPHLHRIRA